MNTDRNALIIDLYVTQGKTQQEISVQMSLSRARVSQILAEAGVTKKDSPRQLQTDRDAFLGVNLAKDVKTAFKQEAKRRQISMSELASELILDTLNQSGYAIESTA